MDTPNDGYATFRDLWLRLAKNIHQSGRPVVLCRSGAPQHVERFPERRYLAEMRDLALECDDRALEDRRRSRPA